VEDLAARLAAVILRTTLVTINWQGDSAERVAYKVQATSAKVLLVDSGVPADELAKVLELLGAGVQLLRATEIASFAPALPPSEPASEPSGLEDEGAGPPSEEATRIVIFTSGTTGLPKGVRLTYGAYACNRSTFENFLRIGDEQQLVALLTNPLHHTNSTALADWAMRRPRARIALLRVYTTEYWRLLVDLASGAAYGEAPAAQPDPQADAAADSLPIPAAAELLGAIALAAASGLRVVAPLVSRHLDFLHELTNTQRLPVSRAALAAAAGAPHVTLLLGSAPVGPTTVANMQRLAGGALPTVRFGSTETCLQVLGTPLDRNKDATLASFQAGWAYRTTDGAAQSGYYIGRPHPPYTEVEVVKSASSLDVGFLKPCAEGEAGRLVTRGRNLMSGYVGDDEATSKAFDSESGWYLNLGDVCYWLKAEDGGKDYYWLARESTLLIRGGANYSYEQVSAELAAFAAATAELLPSDMGVEVVGLRILSEHEDENCVVVELKVSLIKHLAATYLIGRQAALVRRIQCVDKLSP